MGMSMCRRALLPALTALALLAAGSTAHAQAYEIDSPVWDAAIAAGAAHWGSAPCGGDVTYRWTGLPSGVVGYATWLAPSDAQADPARFTQCHIDLDPAADLDPQMFCTALAHELGHLHGHDHVADPHDLMSPNLGDALPECVAAMAPFQAAGAAPAPVATPAGAAATAPARKAKPAKRRAKPAKTARAKPAAGRSRRH
jgi:hypothetical protein